MAAALNFIRHILIANDGPGHQLRKQRNVQQHIPKAGAFQSFVSVYVDHIAQTLKCKERDAHRQNDRRYRNCHARQLIHRPHQKCQVFENTQNSQIDRHCNVKHSLPPGNKQARQIVAEYGKKQKQYIPQSTERIEQQAGRNEPEIFCFSFGQKIIPSKHNG